jgi:hypothetical protein
LVALAFGCGQDHWLATIYPDKATLTSFLDLGEYTSLEKCRRASKSFLSFMGRTGSGDYECGKNCKPFIKDDPNPLMVCKITAR